MSHMMEIESESLQNERTSLDSLCFFEDDDSSRYQCHGLFPYPAMMVPRLQGALMDELLQLVPNGAAAYDPFMGSGTVLSESLSRGLDFYGTDINPLSLLCCEVKSDLFVYGPAKQNLLSLGKRLKRSHDPLSRPDFAGVKKWFCQPVVDELTRIGLEVSKIEDRWCRRIFWLSLAEIVRKFSKTRMSTYKLHIDKSYKAPSRGEVIASFLQVCSRNIELKRSSWEFLESRGLLNEGCPLGNVVLELTDARYVSSTFQADIVVTSPPYGDNQTTVTYGQFSYLPLQFIDLNDIDQNFDRSTVSRPSAIDSASLGGSLRHWEAKLEEVKEHSESLRKSAAVLKNVGRGGEKRLGVFSHDLRQALIGVAQRVRLGGFCMMTLGNRKINNVSIPLDEISCEFLSALGFSKVAAVDRAIAKKRMAGSMNAERILIMKKKG